MKNCAKCQAEIPASIKIDGIKRNLQKRKYCFNCSPFGKHNTRQIHLPPKNGSGRNYQNMGDAQKRYHNQQCTKSCKERRKKRKKELVDHLGGCCLVCGYNKNLAALEFHHRNPNDKNFELTVCAIASKNMNILYTEANKCNLLCANCHREFHYPELNAPVGN